MVSKIFCPPVADWFGTRFDVPTEPQAAAWPSIKAGRHTLIAAPTGSGKTLAAFLAAIDDLVRIGMDGHLTDETHVVYISPLKALSNDIHRNLELPLQGVQERLINHDRLPFEIRTAVRTGDTPPGERERMRRRPPHILVTTPESFYLLLTSESGRNMLSTVRTVIVDEIHALAGSKRGSHLTLSLERLAALTAETPVRVGLSATQRPIEEIARFLIGVRHVGDDATPDCTIIDTGHVRARDLAIEVTPSPLEAVMSNEVWEEVYDRLAELIEAHHTTLIFANTRRLAERVARHLSERIGETFVTAHHGSLAREQRLSAEQRLKNGELRALIATASLELGIDIGEVDLVCQLGSPRSIATLLQRVGRSGHGVGRVPKGRVFPLSRDDLVECAALLDAVHQGELDRVRIPEQPVEVLAQQLVAEVACREYGEDELFELARRAWPYRNLPRTVFDALVRMLAEGISTQHGRGSAYLHRDAVNHRLRARRGARLTAVTNGGTIPDNADYQVILEPEGHFIGTLNEDFAIESLAGDIFQLGNHSYRILRIETGRVRVEDARGQPPNIPFWFGEAPARTDELSSAVSRLRTAVGQGENSVGRLIDEVGLTRSAAEQLVEYLNAVQAVFGALPTLDHVVLERFFDEAGGMQLVVHAPFGSRVNRAWGLALRKRMCRKFNFELQAAATEDAIVLSLTTTHSFPLAEIANYLKTETVRNLLVQALLDAPMFTTRWRWNATVALALRRMRNGKRVPTQLQRMQAEDLITAVFPDQLACLENIAGDREIPDHPLVDQTITDCLTEAMDINGLERILDGINQGKIAITARDLPEPSPLAQEILNARPYAFLDDAPLEERRTQAVTSRRWLDPKTAADLGRLDTAAIARVREEAWPEAVNADELHDGLVLLGFLTEEEAQRVPRWTPFFDELVGARRACLFRTRPGGPRLWVAVERLPQLQRLFPRADLEPEVTVPVELAKEEWTPETALVELLRGRLEALGPVLVAELATALGTETTAIDQTLLALEAEGTVLRGHFTPGKNGEEWCERRLLARIHRYTLKRLRQEIEPVSAADFMRFLFSWQRLTPQTQTEGPQALASIVEQLEGFEAPAAAWEGDLLPARVTDYSPEWLDSLCLSGRVLWSRLTPQKLNGDRERTASPVRSTPIALLSRAHVGLWQSLLEASAMKGGSSLSRDAEGVVTCLERQGASFFDDLVQGSGLLRTQVEAGLGELVAAGRVTADSFKGLRALLVPAHKRRSFAGGRRRHSTVSFGVEDAGRWSLVGTSGGHHNEVDGDRPGDVETIARLLLRRYGVMFRRLLDREGGWLPTWRELVLVYRRLESRGEIRGGRFVAGVTGEQYALPEAVGALRERRRQPRSGLCVSLSAADPLNLVGIITPGPKVPAIAGNRILFRDGVPIAAQLAGETRFLEEVEPDAQWALRNALVKRPVPPELRSYLR